MEGFRLRVLSAISTLVAQHVFKVFPRGRAASVLKPCFPNKDFFALNYTESFGLAFCHNSIVTLSACFVIDEKQRILQRILFLYKAV